MIGAFFTSLVKSIRRLFFKMITNVQEIKFLASIGGKKGKTKYKMDAPKET